MHSYNKNMSKYLKYTEEQKQDAVMRICEEISIGASLTETLNKYGAVSVPSFHYWLKKNPEFKDMYTVAQKHREQFFFDEIIRIAGSEEPTAVKKYRNGELYETIVRDNVESRRLKINALKWCLGKMNPNKYGEKVIVDNETQTAITSIKFIDINDATTD